MIDDPILEYAERRDDVLALDLWYPRSENKGQHNIRAIQLGLMDVRAADDIRISYDFQRDGWKIEQEEIISFGSYFHSTGDWKEVAFVNAWGRERQANENDTPTETSK